MGLCGCKQQTSIAVLRYSNMTVVNPRTKPAGVLRWKKDQHHQSTWAFYWWIPWTTGGYIEFSINHRFSMPSQTRPVSPDPTQSRAPEWTSGSIVIPSMVKSWYHNAQIYGQFMSNMYKIIRVSTSMLWSMLTLHSTPLLSFTSLSYSLEQSWYQAGDEVRGFDLDQWSILVILVTWGKFLSNT